MIFTIELELRGPGAVLLGSHRVLCEVAADDPDRTRVLLYGLHRWLPNHAVGVTVQVAEEVDA